MTVSMEQSSSGEVDSSLGSQGIPRMVWEPTIYYRVHKCRPYPEPDQNGLRPPGPVVARSKTWVCGRSLTGISGSNPAGGMDVCLL
jgi:hypothetical protein